MNGGPVKKRQVPAALAWFSMLGWKPSIIPNPENEWTSDYYAVLVKYDVSAYS